MKNAESSSFHMGGFAHVLNKLQFTNRVSVPQVDLLIGMLLVIRKLPMMQSPMPPKVTVLKESIANCERFL